MQRHISRFKRLFSDIVLTNRQIYKKSSAIFFVIIFLIYFLCPVGDFANRQYFFTNIFNRSISDNWFKAITILFGVSIIHFIYLINITSYFQDTSFKKYFQENSYKSLKAFSFIFLAFCMHFLIFRFFDYTSLKFSSLWLYIFLNNLRLFILYMIIALGTLIIIDLESIRAIFKQFTIKKLIFKLIKIVLLLAIVDLLLSPFFYCLDSNLFYMDRFSNKQDLLNLIYYIIQCLINAAIIIFLYNFVELLVHNRNRELLHRKTFKKITLITLSFLYLFVWFTCGVIYQNLARQSNGRDFIFQEDIKIKLQAKALKDTTNINVDEYTICDLIKNGDLQKDGINFKKGSNGTAFTSSINSSSNIDIVENFDFSENEGTLCVNEIGRFWAEFYASDFYNKGISYYKFDVKDSIDSPRNLGLKSEKLYPVLINLYSIKYKNENFNPPQTNNIRLLNPDEDMSNYELISQQTILIDDSSYIMKLKDGPKLASENNPMYSNLTNILQHSINFITYDYKNISDTYNMIEVTGIRYPLIDFLYYSAVTITTTGYGDILPNSTIIRTVVMFETFFGIGIPGFFVSLLFFRVGHKEKNNE